MTPIKPMAHQLQSLKLMKKQPRVFDMSDPGTGKTYVQIMDFAERRRKKGGCLLVLAPRSLLESAWVNDFNKFAPDMVALAAFANNRAKVFGIPADAYITNIDAAQWLASQKPAFFKKFDTLVIDESTFIKHPGTGRSRAVAKIVRHFNYRRCMSGTATENGILDIWHQIFVLDGGLRLGKTRNGFRNAACLPEKVNNRIEWMDRPNIEATVAMLLNDIVVRHRFEDCVDIPSNHCYAVPFKLEKAHMTKYITMEHHHIIPLKTQKVSAVNGAVVATKLLQIASGAVYDENGEPALIASERYELVLDLVEQRAHSIVFFTWEHQKNELIKAASKRGINHAIYDGGVADGVRSQVIKDYQAGKYKVLFAHPQSAGHGLTLTKGTATIWASPTYNLGHFLQGLKRIHRIGQTEKTETIVIVAKNTIDEHVWAALQAKQVKLETLLMEMT